MSIVNQGLSIIFAQLLSRMIMSYLFTINLANLFILPVSYWQNDYTMDDNITNIRVGVAANDGSGLTNPAGTAPDQTALTYNCDGELLATMTPDINGNNYEIAIVVAAPGASPAQRKASDALKKQFNNSLNKTFRL